MGGSAGRLDLTVSTSHTSVAREAETSAFNVFSTIPAVICARSLARSRYRSLAFSLLRRFSTARWMDLTLPLVLTVPDPECLLTSRFFPTAIKHEEHNRTKGKRCVLKVCRLQD